MTFTIYQIFSNIWLIFFLSSSTGMLIVRSSSSSRWPMSTHRFSKLLPLLAKATMVATVTMSRKWTGSLVSKADGFMLICIVKHYTALACNGRSRAVDHQQDTTASLWPLCFCFPSTYSDLDNMPKLLPCCLHSDCVFPPYDFTVAVL